MKKFFKILGFGLLGLVVLVAILGEETEKGTTQNAVGATPEPTQAVNLPIPEDQKIFVGIVTAGFEAWDAGQTDMQRGAALAQRSTAICAALKTMQVSEWVGKVVLATTNSEGKGVFGVELEKNVTITTYNNALSDIGSDTLIEQSSDVFKDVSSLQKGDFVKFSGVLFSDEETCIREQSLTLKGKVTDPEFTFRFASVSKL